MNTPAKDTEKDTDDSQLEELGQDRVSGVPEPETPSVLRDRSESASAESRRPTEAVKVRLLPEDALRLEVQAKSSGRTKSAYVAYLVNRDGIAGNATPSGMADPELRAEVVRLASAIFALRENLKLTRADMGRALGLLKNLFNQAPAAAERHHHELHQATLAAREAIVRADNAVEEATQGTDALRARMDDLAAWFKRNL